MPGRFSLPRSFALTLVGLLASCATTAQSPSPAPESERPDSLFGVLVGGRSLDDEVAWDEIESPIVLAFEGGNVGQPLGYEFGLSVAGDSTTVAGVDVYDRFAELSFGARALFGSGRVIPYLGAGLALVWAEVEGEASGFSTSDDDASAGLYGHAGVLFPVGSEFWLGLDGRVLTGTELDIFGIETDADYSQLALVFAWGG